MMTRRSAVLMGFALGVLVLLVGFAAGTGFSEMFFVSFGAAAFLLVSALAVRLATKSDRFLVTLLPIAYLAKLIGAGARYWVLEVIYGGAGDASGYHGAGIQLAQTWRSFQIPDMSSGTAFMDGVTGLLFVPYVPTKLGGFLIFATISFVGQILFYLAFRSSIIERRNRLYAIAIFFLPTMVYWPSSIGKEALMVLGLGAAAYGAARVFTGSTSIGSLALIGAGLALSAAIRPHVAAMLAGSLALAIVVSSGRGLGLTAGRRLRIVGLVGIAVAVLVYVSAGEFGIDLTTDVVTEIDEFVVNLEDQTGKGGSAVAGGTVRSPLDVPGAALKVLFRPLVHEAHNVTALASALEGTALLALVIWLMPSMLRNARRARSDPYLILSLTMVLLFVIAFSSFSNLGLLARERTMVAPFLVVILTVLGGKDTRLPSPPPPERVRQPSEESGPSSIDRYISS